ncbi:hypothetical protein SDC9_60068 [bioreactor metagenome]|uniref:Uncharacterized protein n=1 Tax=bioreactor metagenome TaxID=1076179 RepID=A0A644XC83_9ZZZZ
MKQHVHFYVLSACILIAAAMICFIPGRSAAAGSQTSAAEDFRLEKLNNINDKVLRREVLEEDCLYYLSDNEALCDALREYNKQTAIMYLNYSQDAMNICNALFYEHKESPGDYAQPMLYYEWAGRIAKLALYRNCEQLCDADPYLSYPLAKESGGSYGIWAGRMHLSSDERIEQSDAYFTMIDALLVRLDEYRQSLS